MDVDPKSSSESSDRSGRVREAGSGERWIDSLDFVLDVGLVRVEDRGRESESESDDMNSLESSFFLGCLLRFRGAAFLGGGLLRLISSSRTEAVLSSRIVGVGCFVTRERVG